MRKDADKNWEKFHLEKVQANYPRWPNEAMLKIVFGSYLKNRITLAPDSRVLDVGCGFGNNLLPFLEKGFDCYGVELTAAIARTSQQLLRQRGFDAQIKRGRNSGLPFADNFFDLMLSLNVLHYEKTEQNIKAGLTEYRRVLKPGGTLLLMTVGPEHAIYQRAKPVGPHQYKIANYDFRDGEQYFYFDNLKYLDYYLSQHFRNIELGRVTERLFTLDLDFLVAVCRNKLPA